MTLYSAKTSDGSFRITKFDGDLNPEASYLTSPEACECPAGVRPTCRHRQMLPEFLARDAVDSPLFLDWDKRQWVDTSSIFDTTVEGLAERPLNPAVNELMDLAPEASSITKADLAKAFNAVAEAVGVEDMKQEVPLVQGPEMTATEVEQRIKDYSGPLPGDSLTEALVDDLHKRATELVQPKPSSGVRRI